MEKKKLVCRKCGLDLEAIENDIKVAVHPIRGEPTGYCTDCWLEVED